jgi:hypothetical protein
VTLLRRKAPPAFSADGDAAGSADGDAAGGRD